MNTKQQKIVWLMAITISFCSILIGFSRPFFRWWDFSVRQPTGFIVFVFIIPILIMGGMFVYRAKTLDSPGKR